MRLIDADAFIEYLGLDEENSREENLGEIVTLEDFDRQPTVYDAVMSKTLNVMTGNRKDRTDECISAVAEHMMLKAEDNEGNKGFYQYHWKGVGTLTWESELQQNGD